LTTNVNIAPGDRLLARYSAGPNGVAEFAGYEDFTAYTAHDNSNVTMGFSGPLVFLSQCPLVYHLDERKSTQLRLPVQDGRSFWMYSVCEISPSEWLLLYADAEELVVATYNLPAQTHHTLLRIPKEAGTKPVLQPHGVYILGSERASGPYGYYTWQSER
jgi:hypothetical protein